ncbi:hypothetical protein FOZ76_22045 [Verticiella sediminum]|uniref:Uncharacterized protein n=1 Tax=Verticiella sediminum TaxID=1247510 RepID=A0A556AC81_9BURK|nr:hypothetical protein [Verticiella sediminum]TSH90495.1 hypothetical protein FOZ76_22045 [Verticiella sediminum]
MNIDHTPHHLAPGYYWYSLDGDPYCILHVHEHGTASLMGTSDEMSAEDLAAFIARGCKIVRIEPPAPDGL